MKTRHLDWGGGMGLTTLEKQNKTYRPIWGMKELALITMFFLCMCILFEGV